MYKAALFDLDGTLTESGEGIVKSVQYALEKLGIPTPDPRDLLCFVGPPLVKSFMKYFDLSREKADRGVDFYRERFGKIGIFENKLYPGVRGMLEDLKDRGYLLAIASSKPEDYILRILDYFEISSFFDVVTGSLMKGGRNSKTEVIEECLARLGMKKDRRLAVMVGDREHDMKGALDAGIDCIGVLYGYGDREELEKAGASHIAETVEDLRTCLLASFQAQDRPDPGPETDPTVPVKDDEGTPGGSDTEAPSTANQTPGVPDATDPEAGSLQSGGPDARDAQPGSLYGDLPLPERLRRQLDFALEIDKEKNIFRQTHLSGHGRNENDAEHAWHMAVMAWLLREYANEEVDISRVMLMCLIHDIVEIDAGDTYAYDQEGLATQKAREDAAKERIFSILPPEQKEELTAIFDEFEACETAESRFAHAMDNLQPLLLNNSNQGGDWRQHKVSAAQVYGRQKKTRMGSEELYRVTDSIIRKNIKEGNLLP